MAWLKAILELIPLIKQLLGFFIETPEEKREKIITSLHSSFKKARETGDTSGLEAMVRKGRQ